MRRARVGRGAESIVGWTWGGSRNARSPARGWSVTFCLRDRGADVRGLKTGFFRHLHLWYGSHGQQGRWHGRREQ